MRAPSTRTSPSARKPLESSTLPRVSTRSARMPEVTAMEIQGGGLSLPEYDRFDREDASGPNRIGEGVGSDLTSPQVLTEIPHH